MFFHRDSDFTVVLFIKWWRIVDGVKISVIFHSSIKFYPTEIENIITDQISNSGTRTPPKEYNKVWCSQER
jgi:hypothetical protein